MITKPQLYRLIAGLSALSVLALMTMVAKSAGGLNAITVALLYLLVVLTTSALAGQVCGIAVAVTSGLLVNYFFLPPFGTFYIASSEDWLSFAAYTVVAVVVSHFAATVRRRAVEADCLQAQVSQLARFAEALNMARRENLTLDFVVTELRRTFVLSYCAIYLFREPVASRSQAAPELNGQIPPPLPCTLLEATILEGAETRCLPLSFQGKTIGVLAISQEAVSPMVANALAAVVAPVVGRLPAGHSAK